MSSGKFGQMTIGGLMPMSDPPWKTFNPVIIRNKGPRAYGRQFQIFQVSDSFRNRNSGG